VGARTLDKLNAVAESLGANVKQDAYLVSMLALDVRAQC
jgi:hypothetical protein